MVAKDTTCPFPEHDTIYHAGARVHQTTIGQSRQIMRPTTGPCTAVLFGRWYSVQMIPSFSDVMLLVPPHLERQSEPE